MQSQSQKSKSIQQLNVFDDFAMVLILVRGIRILRSKINSCHLYSYTTSLSDKQYTEVLNERVERLSLPILNFDHLIAAEWYGLIQQKNLSRLLSISKQ